MTNTFRSWLETQPLPLLADGAMGTLLHTHGVPFDHCFDELNVSQPGIVMGIHQAYLHAGAQIIKTNTFGANQYKLTGHGLEHRVVELNRAGVTLARQAIGESGKEALIAGDVGPLGVRIAPFGRVQLEQARAAFHEQIAALVEAGVDLILIETISDLYEAREAVAAAREISTLPIVASMTFTRDDRTLLGDTPAKIATRLHEAGADVIGVNCSGGPVQALRILIQMRQAIPEARFSVMPNAGWPEQVGGRIMYPAGPAYFGHYALAFRQAGAVLIGGCCGTTPEHIAAMHEAMAEPSKVPVLLPMRIPLSPAPAPTATEPASPFAQKLRAKKFVVGVEMDPPRGLGTQKLLAGASMLADAGADVINVADSPMARMRMSPWAVCNLIQNQAKIDTVLHFPTRGRNLLRVQGDLLAAHALGIRNVFVVMGDPTEIGDYPEAMDNYDLVPSGLIKLIKQEFNTGVDHAGGDLGQPTSFFVGCALNLTPQEPEREIKNLRRKLEAGADFILTQPVYEPELAEQFLKRYADQHGPLDCPVLVGVLPLYGVRHAEFLHHEVPGISIPETLRERMRQAAESGPKEGIRIAIELIEQFRHLVAGVYLMPPFGRYDMAAEIIERTK